MLMHFYKIKLEPTIAINPPEGTAAAPMEDNIVIRLKIVKISVLIIIK